MHLSYDAMPPKYNVFANKSATIERILCQMGIPLFALLHKHNAGSQAAIM